jgi:hypothetical protein
MDSENCNFIKQAYISGGGRTDSLFIYDIIFNLQSWLLYLQTELTQYVSSLSKNINVCIIQGY